MRLCGGKEQKRTHWRRAPSLRWDVVGL